MLLQKSLTLGGNSLFNFFYLTLKRNATIFVEEFCHLGVIDKNTYEQYLLNERLKAKIKEEKFLIENFFFKYIRPSIFDNKYFNQFIYKEFTSGQILFNTNDEIDYIYFIKEGEIELLMNNSIVQISKLLLDLTHKTNITAEEPEYKMAYNPFFFQKDLKLERAERVS